MVYVNSIDLGGGNPGAQFRGFASAMSDFFGGRWHVEPNGVQQRSMELNWRRGYGVGLSRAQMTPVRLSNSGVTSRKRPQYSLCFMSQPVYYRRGNVSFQVHPDEIFISSPQMSDGWISTHDYQTSCIIFDADLFEQYIPDAGKITGRTLRASKSVRGTLRSIIDCAWETTDDCLFPHVGGKFARSFLEVLSVALLPQAADEREDSRKIYKALDTRRSQIKSFIRSNFRDPDLSIDSIARHFGISPRYIQLALSGERLTPSQYIRNLRLEECAGILGSGATGKTISEVAFSNGFSNSSYFCLQFRRRFGVSPRDYRARSPVHGRE